MGLNDTPSANRIQIGFFGKRNAGKSSLINVITGQKVSIVSDVLGTTTDPVYKSMELLPLGPVLMIDTPGYDDDDENMGVLRLEKMRQVLHKVDVAVIVVDGTKQMDEKDAAICQLLEQKKIPYIVAYNKMDVTGERELERKNAICVSALQGNNIQQLKEMIAHVIRIDEEQAPLVKDLLHPLDYVLLVVPIDKAAPKGRLILPQQQVIRDALEAGAIPIVVRDCELEQFLTRFQDKLCMVITDSQVFEMVSKIVPDEILLTSFSILMARYKGYLEAAVNGVIALNQLEDGDHILISEGCTHHRQCGDIGSEKLPAWIRSYTGKHVIFDFSSGNSFPEDLSAYKMVIHCGGCMLNEREVRYRMQCAIEQGVPFTNYGTAIAHMKGILERSLRVFGNQFAFIKDI